MVTPRWISLNEKQDRSDGYVRIVSGPVENQGLRDALRCAFAGRSETEATPADFEALLAKLH